MAVEEYVKFRSKPGIAVGAFVLATAVSLSSCSTSPESVQNDGSTNSAIVNNSPLSTPMPDKSLPGSRSKIDENDGYPLYSVATLKENYKEADVVVYAEVIRFVPDSKERGYRHYTGTAKIKEVFKGEVAMDDLIEHGWVIEVYDEEPDVSAFLGERVLWLKRWDDNGRLRYGQIEFMAGGIESNILEKLRKISKAKR